MNGDGALFDEPEDRDDGNEDRGSVLRRAFVRIVVVLGVFVLGVFVGGWLEKKALEQDHSFDANWDGTLDSRYEYELDGSSRYFADTNFDGAMDLIVHHDKYGITRRATSDTDFDGTHDVDLTYEHGVITRAIGYRDRSRPPTIETEYEHGIAVLERVDRNGDGAFDVLYRFDHLGIVVAEEAIPGE